MERSEWMSLLSQLPDNWKFVLNNPHLLPLYTTSFPL